MKDVIQHINILKSHKSETYSVNDGRVKVTGKPSKYFSLTYRPYYDHFTLAMYIYWVLND